MDNFLTYTFRITRPFLVAVPPVVKHFDAYIYSVVKRKPGMDIPHEKWGVDVRLNPCILDWDKKCITIKIPLDINTGITSIDDLDPDFYEDVQAAFLTLISNCL